MKEGVVRAIVLCVFSHHGKILVSESFDQKKNQTFYRPLGGGIEIAEKSDQALKREIQEELQLQIISPKLLGVLENIFTHRNMQGHEIIFVYDAQFRDPDVYNKETLEGTDPEGKNHKGIWKDILDFKEEKLILYPEGILKLILKPAI